jgi:N-acetylglutamate synthase-like GNAT family acetyltransferase
MERQVEAAGPEDCDGIHQALCSNREDTSLAQQPRALIERNLGEFVVVRDPAGRVIGCTQVKQHRPGYVEILAVSIRPEAQGQGVGGLLMRRAVEVALESSPSLLWLSTEKPAYFARFGFERFSMWAIPLPILLGKLRVVFRQRIGRWIPSIFVRTVFMRYVGPARR